MPGPLLIAVPDAVRGSAQSFQTHCGRHPTQSTSSA